MTGHLTGVEPGSGGVALQDERHRLGAEFRPYWAEACAKAGVSGLHFHDLRGSGATWAATTGATVRELMTRLGHTTPTVAMRYQHATLDRDQAIAEKLDALMRAASTAQPEPTAQIVPIDRLPDTPAR